MKEAPSFEGAFLVSATPPWGRHRGRVLVTVGAWLAVQDGSASLERPGPSSVTPNSAWNVGQ
jgi:hypothetical protein